MQRNSLLRRAEQSMDRLHLMTVFVAVAETESFAAASRRLGLSPPAVTRAIAALEERLGVKLFRRTTRFVRATEAGLRYLEDSRRVIAAADDADLAAAGVNAAPRGQLAVTAPVLFGRMFVLPAIVEYLRRYPAMEVSALFVDRVVNLLEEGMDVGIRIGDLPDSSMKATRVGAVRRVLCATPEYLKKQGIPDKPAALSAHTIIAASGVSPTNDWKFRQGAKSLTVPLIPRLTVNSNDAAIEATLRGFGIARLLSYQIAPEVASGRLKIILSDFEPPAMPIHVVHRDNRYGSAKLRSFVDLVAERLRKDRALS